MEDLAIFQFNLVPFTVNFLGVRCILSISIILLALRRLENMLNSTATTWFLSLLGFHGVARRLQNGSLSETRREDATAVASTKLCVLVVCMLLR